MLYCNQSKDSMKIRSKKNQTKKMWKTMKSENLNKAAASSLIFGNYLLNRDIFQMDSPFLLLFRIFGISTL